MRERTEAEFTPRLLGSYELAKYLGLGRCRAVEFGKKCQADRRFGKRLLFDRTIIDAELDKLQ